MKQHKMNRIICDIESYTLSSEEKELIDHPLIGGVILFSKNYQSKKQLKKLIETIRRINPKLLITTDHEGGRIQRFIEEFSVFPSARNIGKEYDLDNALGLRSAYKMGRMIGRELCAMDLDFSLAPVLDVDWGKSAIIGDRAFHSDPAIIIKLAEQFCAGMHSFGMPSVAKHFPGHGYAIADSHKELPVDRRALKTIKSNDLLPFKALAEKGIAGIMTAHIHYSRIDKRIPTFSPVWLKTILRQQLCFEGLIFSDDLTMQAATKIHPDIQERADCALDAGCDVLILCNDRPRLIELLDRWKPPPLEANRIETMHRKSRKN